MFGSGLDAAIEQELQPQKQGRKIKALTPAQQQLRTTTVLEKWLGITGLKKFRDPAGGAGKR